MMKLVYVMWILCMIPKVVVIGATNGCHLEWDSETIRAFCRIPFVKHLPHAYAIDFAPIANNDMRQSSTACGSRASTSHQEVTNEDFWNIPFEWTKKPGYELSSFKSSSSGVAYPRGPGFWSCEEPREDKVECQGKWPLDLWLLCIKATEESTVNANLYVTLFVDSEKAGISILEYVYPITTTIGSSWRITGHIIGGSSCVALTNGEPVTLLSSGSSNKKEMRIQFGTNVYSPCHDNLAGYLVPSELQAPIVDTSVIALPQLQQFWDFGILSPSFRPFKWTQKFALWLCKDSVVGVCYAEQDQFSMTVNIAPNVVLVTNQAEMIRPSVKVISSVRTWNPGSRVNVLLNATNPISLIRSKYAVTEIIGPILEEMNVFQIDILKETKSSESGALWRATDSEHSILNSEPISKKWQILPGEKALIVRDKFTYEITKVDSYNINVALSVPQLDEHDSLFKAQISVHWRSANVEGNETYTVSFFQRGCDVDQMFHHDRLECSVHRISAIVYVFVTGCVAGILYIAVITLRWMEQKKEMMYMLEPDFSSKVKNYA